MRVAGKKERQKEVQRIAILGALSLILASLEYLIPKPLPFLRLGLANLPLLFGLPLLSAGPWFTLVGIKVLAQAFIGGTLVSWIFLFSLVGSLASALTMFFLHRLGRKAISFIGISLAGAVNSNIAQLTLAYFCIFGEATRYMAPLMLSVGAISGLLLGVFANKFAKNSLWYAATLAGESKSASDSAGESSGKLPAKPATADKPPSQKTGRRERFFALALCALLFTLAFFYLRIPHLGYKALLALIFFILGRIRSQSLSPLSLLLATAGIVFFSLLVPSGEIYFTILKFPITSGALHQGLDRALSIEGLILFSRAFLDASLLRRLGAVDGLIGATFASFDILNKEAKNFSPRNPIKGIDSLLFAAERKGFRP